MSKVKRWTWEIKCYCHAVKADDIAGGFRLAPSNPGRDDRPKCPGCKEPAQPFELIDLRALPQSFIDTLPPALQWFGFVCSGCWSDWERKGKDCGDGRPFDEAILCEMAGAPPECVAELRKVIDDRVAKFAESQGALIDCALEAKGQPKRMRARNWGADGVAASLRP